jgi:hypothetical protein
MPESSERARPLWQWLLLAIVPGLMCDALGVLSLTAHTLKLDELTGFIMVTLMAAPLLGFIYLIFLGRRYVAAGMATSPVGFVIGYGLLNTLLWGAGCSMQLSTLSFH